MRELEILIPRDVELDDGTRIMVSEDEARRTAPEHVFELWVPRERIEDVVSELRRQGFEDAWLSVSFGEKYSLRLKIFEPWEVHVRIFDDGSMVSEIEISREYIEHLTSVRLPVLYDVYYFYRRAYPSLHIRYRPVNRWVKQVYSHYKFVMTPPTTGTPWIPILTGIVGFAFGALLGYVIARELKRP